MESNNNGHQHAQSLEEISISFDPQNGRYCYNFRNCDYRRLIGHLEMVKQLAFRDLMIAMAAEQEKRAGQ